MANKKNDKVVDIQNASEEIQVKPDSPVKKFGQSVATAAENAKVDLGLFWQRNKKRVFVLTGMLAGAALGVLGLKALSEQEAFLVDEDGNLVYDSDEESDAGEVENEATVEPENEM